MQQNFMQLSHDLESSARDLSHNDKTGTVGLGSVSSEALCKPMRESLLPWQSRQVISPGSCQVLPCLADVFHFQP